MLNYIWAGLIIISLLFALSTDISDLLTDKYRNRQPLPVTLVFPEAFDPAARQEPVEVRIDPAMYQAFYRVDDTPAEAYEGVLFHLEIGRELRFARDQALPAPLDTIREMSGTRDNELRAAVHEVEPIDEQTAAAQIVFDPVRFVVMARIQRAAFQFAETAVTIAIGFIGLLALWLGLVRIGERAGLIAALVKVTQPLLRPLFPQIPKDHPALAMISLNLSANVLGLGNAATPMGIKAMEELQKLNQKKDTATNSMVMLLAMNTASVQLLPPAMLIAIMGFQANRVIFPILIVTGISLFIAITAARLLGRLTIYRRTDPALTSPATDDPAAANEQPPPDG